MFFFYPICLCLQVFLMAGYTEKYMPMIKGFYATENAAFALLTFSQWLLGNNKE